MLGLGDICIFKMDLTVGDGKNVPIVVIDMGMGVVFFFFFLQVCFKFIQREFHCSTERG